MANPELTPRQELAAERILEDERLTAGLTDAAARRLVDWGSRAAAAAAGPEHDDAAAEARVGQVAAAIREAARAAQAGADPVAAAEAALARLAAPQLAGGHGPGLPAPAAQAQRGSQLARRLWLARRRVSLGGR